MMSNEINPGIRKTVAWLQSLGYETTDSGDGITNVEAKMEGVLAFAHVMIKVDPDNLIYFAGVLANEIEQNLGLKVVPISNDWQDICIQATYDPADNSAMIMLSGLDDYMLEQALEFEND